MRTIGSRDAARIDQAAMEGLGLPRAVLMENAARAVADAAERMAEELPSPVRFHVVCGKGSNGGDGYAAARLLWANGRDVRICETEPGAPTDPESATNRGAAFRLGIPFCGIEGFDLPAEGSASAVVLDGVYGTGFRDGALPVAVAELFSRIRACRGPHCRVLAIDIASGTAGDTGRVAPGALEADATVAFVLPKTGSVAMPGLLNTGRLLVAPIGFPVGFALSVLADIPKDAPQAPEWADDAWVAAFAPRRPQEAHKGLFGRVVVCGGAPGTPGAVCMTAEAAGRSGVGRVWGVVPDAIVPVCVATLPETMWHGLDARNSEASTALFVELLREKDACAIGPGLGTAPLALALVEAVLRSPLPVVLDADALRCIASDPDRYLPLLSARRSSGLAPAVLTPHAAEFEALSRAARMTVEDAPPLSAASTLAARLGCIVVRKGHGTVVADAEGHAWLNTTGGDGLAKGGSGDLLCGLIAGFIAQHIPPAEAAVCAVHLHGAAGDLAAERLGSRAMLPRDLLDDLPGAYRRCGWEKPGRICSGGEGHA